MSKERDSGENRNQKQRPEQDYRTMNALMTMQAQAQHPFQAAAFQPFLHSHQSIVGSGGQDQIQDLLRSDRSVQSSFESNHHRQAFFQQSEAGGQGSSINRYAFIQDNPSSSFHSTSTSVPSNINQMYLPISISQQNSNASQSNLQGTAQGQIGMNTLLARTASISETSKSPVPSSSSSPQNVLQSDPRMMMSNPIATSQVQGSQNNSQRPQPTALHSTQPSSSSRQSNFPQGMVRGISEPGVFPTQSVQARQGMSIESGIPFNNDPNLFSTIPTGSFHDNRISFSQPNIQDAGRTDQRGKMDAAATNVVGMPISVLDQTHSQTAFIGNPHQVSEHSNYAQYGSIGHNVGATTSTFRHPSTSSSSTSSNSSVRNITQKRVPAACNFCRVRKLRCDGSTPCRQCTRRMIECVYSQAAESRKQRRATVSSSTSTASNLISTSNPITNVQTVQNSFTSIPTLQRSTSTFYPPSSFQQQQAINPLPFSDPHSTEIGTDLLPNISSTSQFQRQDRPVSRHSEPSSFSSSTRTQPYQQQQTHFPHPSQIQQSPTSMNPPNGGNPTSWTSVPLYAPHQRVISSNEGNSGPSNPTNLLPKPSFNPYDQHPSSHSYQHGNR